MYVLLQRLLRTLAWLVSVDVKSSRQQSVTTNHLPSIRRHAPPNRRPRHRRPPATLTPRSRRRPAGVRRLSAAGVWTGERRAAWTPTPRRVTRSRRRCGSTDRKSRRHSSRANPATTTKTTKTTPPTAIITTTKMVRLILRTLYYILNRNEFVALSGIYPGLIWGWGIPPPKKKV